ncbi:MAG TPA: hypothetical protein VF631_03225 [Allosphingosinicella sp.]|jgi:hypothetical protein|uniref:hypothetical protein n=1 Tax=Allosphingosinicella sp. TaxID=2823234 RepID=UPI002F27D168
MTRSSKAGKRRTAQRASAAGALDYGHTEGGIILFDNARRARRVRWLIFGSSALCLGCLYSALDLLRTYGLSPGDGGVLRPLGERWAVAALLAMLGVAQLAGILFYAGLYLVRVELSAKRLILSTLRPFGTKRREVEAAKIGSVRFHDWALEPGSSVSTPWLALRVVGRRSPFILDLGAEYVDRAAIEKLCDASAE